MLLRIPLPGWFCIHVRRDFFRRSGRKKWNSSFIIYWRLMQGSKCCFSSCSMLICSFALLVWERSAEAAPPASTKTPVFSSSRYIQAWGAPLQRVFLHTTCNVKAGGGKTQMQVEIVLEASRLSSLSQWCSSCLLEVQFILRIPICLHWPPVHTAFLPNFHFCWSQWL